jgi:hypothetical protein
MRGLLERGKGSGAEQILPRLCSAPLFRQNVTVTRVADRRAP